MTEDPWPWLGDNLTDRARRVARSYRDLAQRHAPQECARLDERTIQLGQTWIVPTIETHQLDDLLTRWQAAAYCHVRANTISKWKERGLAVTQTPDGERYRVKDLIAYQRAVRNKRITPERSK